MTYTYALAHADSQRCLRDLRIRRWQRTLSFRILKGIVSLALAPFLILLGARKAERSIVLAFLSVSAVAYA